MKAKFTPITPEQFREKLRAQGITITQWSLARGYSRREVYDVLNGIKKGHFGKAHEIAVALGMKPSTPAESCNLQKSLAA